MARNLLAALSRKKRNIDGAESELARVLSLVDLTALGVGATLGLGVYVLAGSIAKDVAGPAVAISFLIAAFASAVAGLCYAEFACRVPKAGSAYVYSYVSVGEFIAYVIGWNLILEYVIGTASVARGFTNYLDTLVDHKISNTLTDWLPINISFLSSYPDFVSFALVLILTALLSAGVKESTSFNNAFTVLNLATIAIVLVGAGMKADTANWRISKDDIPKNVTWAGDGGYSPHGFAGIMAGAAKCFYGFVGFDAIATTGEEAKNPQRDIPLAIVISLLIIFFAYFGISTVITLAWPYYDQDKEAPLPILFEHLNWPVLKWLVTIGALCALSTSLLGAMFPLPRVLYAMGDDGVIFKALAKVHPRFKTPLLATIISGFLAGFMAAIFNLEQLIDMMSIGTLMAYGIVAICVLILRYEPCDANKKYLHNLELGEKDIGLLSLFKLAFNLNNNKQANLTTALLTKWAIALFSLLTIFFCAILACASEKIKPSEPLIFISFILISVSLLVNVYIIARQPVDDIELSFKVPWVPFIPCLCIICNLYLMLQLDWQTWVRFTVWLAIGFLIYFFYGINHSKEGLLQLKEDEISRINSNRTNGQHSNNDVDNRITSKL
ncbi:cationic amino acid transporter 3-like [Coccinella septempunctata]|uniref:cationic amino acid transporter 3-like n=1 Tax=Coccinella septempunctata TaxID=41139 RepID=UPI001D066E04|nr:cationic amino acid transporter 3-like [Coccinella septempunctata]XP_044754714.1 cationic amino acid transporter 3-like [Coccinella septempunctata]